MKLVQVQSKVFGANSTNKACILKTGFSLKYASINLNQ